MGQKIASPADLLALKKKAQEGIDLRDGPKEMLLTVHMGTCGIAAGARDILAAFASEFEKSGVKNATLRQVGCVGLCDREPMITLTDKDGKDYRYGKLDAVKVSAIVANHVVKNQPVMEYLIEK